MVRHRPIKVLLIVLLSFGLASCGSDDSNSVKDSSGNDFNSGNPGNPGGGGGHKCCLRNFSNPGMSGMGIQFFTRSEKQE